MRFLLDANIERRLAHYLRERGHDVTVVGQDYPRTLPDSEILAHARNEGRIVVTNDRDYGELIFHRGHAHAGVVYFRMGAGDFEDKQAQLQDVLDRFPHEMGQFIILDGERVRIRRSPLW